MQIKIKEFHGTPVVRGFYPKSGVRLLPGQVYTFEKDEEDLYHACLDTEFVEPVIERPKRGRPKNEDGESGA